MKGRRSVHRERMTYDQAMAQIHASQSTEVKSAIGNAWAMLFDGARHPGTLTGVFSLTKPLRSHLECMQKEAVRLMKGEETE